MRVTAMLRVSEDDKWAACARRLGFTEREVRVHLARAKDPFAAMFAAFKARDGRPEEFVQTLYLVSRMANVDTTTDSDYSSGWSSFSGTSSGIARSAFGEDPEEGYHDGEEEDGACDAATIKGEGFTRGQGTICFLNCQELLNLMFHSKISFDP